MKKIATFLLVLLLNSITMIQARTLQEAAQVANDFIAERSIIIASHAQRTAMQRPVELAYTQYQLDDTTPAFYIFNATENNGFVLVSAEDEARTILGYADKGSFDEDNMPANMHFWLQMYADELAHMSQKQQRKVVMEMPVPPYYSDVTPILEGVAWGQTAPFNDQCPKISGAKCPTGCAATAVAQIMYAHKYPAQGVGHHSYTTNSYKQKLSADFAATTYEWEKMLPSYAGEYSDDAKNAVATLMSHVGIAMEMDYTPTMSAVGINDAMIGLMTCFGYDKDIRALPKYYMPEDEILRTISVELQAGRPVYIEGTTVNQEGHAFVCDGIEGSGMLHINWGWDGMCDGYFALSAMAPDIHGVGGSATGLAFTENVSAYVGIRPDEGGKTQAYMTASTITRTCDDVIGRDEKVDVTVMMLYNCGLNDVQGMMNYNVYDKQGELVAQLPCVELELLNGYYYGKIEMSHTIPSDLGAGDYELEVVLVEEDGTSNTFMVPRRGIVRMPMILSDTAIWFVPQTELPLKPIERGQIINVNGTKQWLLTLFSKDFLNWYPSATDQVIQCTITTQKNTSIIGSYTWKYSSSVGEITNPVYGVGILQACQVMDIDDMHLTFLPGEDGKLELLYRVTADGQVIEDKCTITPEWYMQKGAAYYYYNDDITNDLSAILTPAQAIEIAQALPDTAETKMQYIVCGTISNMRNTPEQIVQYNSANFDISSDGTTNNQLYCYNTRWIDNTDFITGEEITVGNEVVVLGSLQNYNGTTPEIKGYIYEFNEKPQPNDFTITELSLLSIEGMKVTVGWNTNAPMVEVRLLNAKNKQIGKLYTADKQVSFTAPEIGQYTICVRPVDEDKQYLADEVKLVVEVDDYSVKDLALVSVDNMKVTVAWTTKAPLVEVRLLNANNKQIGKRQISESQITFTAPEVGLYTICVRPMDNNEQYLAEEVKLVIEVTASTDVENVFIKTNVIEKVLRDGQLLIIRDGKTYNVLGWEL